MLGFFVKPAWLNIVGLLFLVRIAASYSFAVLNQVQYRLRHARHVSCSWQREIDSHYFDGPRMLTGSVRDLASCAQMCGNTYGCVAANLFSLSRSKHCTLLSAGLATSYGKALTARGQSKYIDGIYCQGGSGPTPKPAPQYAPALPAGGQQDYATCGVQSSVRSMFGQKRIIGGHNAAAHNWPWLVAILLNGQLACGGVLWRSDVVITAAHCLEKGTQGMTMIIGAQSLADVNPNVERRSVARFVAHEYYNTHTVDNDIALVRLDRPVTLGLTKKLICLPQPNEHPALGTSCVIAGWGTLINHPTQVRLPRVLQEANVNVMSRDACNYWTSYNNRLTQNMFCAGVPSGQVDACLGDSGGPLVCRSSSGAWMMSGIISWGEQCANPQFPGIYTKVANYVGWIYANVGRI